MKVGDRVKFDYMGKEHSGTVLEITASNGMPLSCDVVLVKSDRHVSSIVINTTLFPERVREYESR